MSFATSFGLSLKNLFTKKGRTALTSFAGSIGIIGIALIYSVSQGMNTYIRVLQEETLSSYPLTIESQYMDLGTLMETFIGKAQSEKDHEHDAVYQKSMVYDLISSISSMETTTNDLKSFKEFIEKERADENSTYGLNQAVSGVSYTYDFDMLVYTQSVDGSIIQSDSQKLLREIMSEFFGNGSSSNNNMGNTNTTGSSSSPFGSLTSMGGSTGLWQEMLSGDNGKLVNPILEKQYDVVYGSWPTQYNEVVLVLDKNNELDDMSLYALGLKSNSEIDEMVDAAINEKEVASTDKKWTYEEICDMEYKVILNSDCYTLDENTGLYTDLRDSSAGLRYLYDNGTVLKVSGIIKPNPDVSTTMLKGSIGYTSKLTQYVIEKAKESSAIEAQLKNPSIDIFTGLPFQENKGNLTEAQKETEFRNYISNLDTAEKAKAYVAVKSIPSQEQIDASVSQMMGNMTRDEMAQRMVQVLIQQTGMSENEVEKYVKDMSDENLTAIFTKIVAEQVKAQYAAQVKEQMATMDSAQLAAALDAESPTYTAAQCAVYYDQVLDFSKSTYDSNLLTMGYVDLANPSTINLYASSFADKDVVKDAITKYNETVEDISEIAYTDYVGLIMSSVTLIINAITSVLIAFVAVSLIVSSIMIGVITLISVQERTKEIGILRAIGASKRNVSSMFNVETVIIGFTSGTLGVLITYLLCIPINMILHSLTGLSNLNAYLPVPVAIVLVFISMALTLIAGIIPSRSAAKKDPVVALRTE